MWWLIITAVDVIGCMQIHLVQSTLFLSMHKNSVRMNVRSGIYPHTNGLANIDYVEVFQHYSVSRASTYQLTAYFRRI